MHARTREDQFNHAAMFPHCRWVSVARDTTTTTKQQSKNHCAHRRERMGLFPVLAGEGSCLSSDSFARVLRGALAAQRHNTVPSWIFSARSKNGCLPRLCFYRWKKRQRRERGVNGAFCLFFWQFCFTRVFLFSFHVFFLSIFLLLLCVAVIRLLSSSIATRRKRDASMKQRRSGFHLQQRQRTSKNMQTDMQRIHLPMVDAKLGKINNQLNKENICFLE